MIIHDKIEQRSDEWFKIRQGIPTASCANKLLTPTGKLSSQSKGYMCELIAEKLGFAAEPFEPTEHMLRGIELEPEARAFYELDSGQDVTEVGFVTNDDGTAGFSPDGLIFQNGHPVAGLEIKVPRVSTHIGYVIDDKLPGFYAPQIHFSLAISGLDRWIFMSYAPGLDPLIVLVERDGYTEKVKTALDEFLKRLAEESERFGLSLDKAA